MVKAVKIFTGKQQVWSSIEGNNNISVNCRKQRKLPGNIHGSTKCDDACYGMRLWHLGEKKNVENSRTTVKVYLNIILQFVWIYQVYYVGRVWSWISIYMILGILKYNLFI